MNEQGFKFRYEYAASSSLAGATGYGSVPRQFPGVEHKTYALFWRKCAQSAQERLAQCFDGGIDVEVQFRLGMVTS